MWRTDRTELFFRRACEGPFGGARVTAMSTSYLCAACDLEFALEGANDDPRCPQCHRTEAVEPARGSALQSDIWRQWLIVFALLFIAGIAYLWFE